MMIVSPILLLVIGDDFLITLDSLSLPSKAKQNLIICTGSPVSFFPSEVALSSRRTSHCSLAFNPTTSHNLNHDKTSPSEHLEALDYTRSFGSI